MIKIDIYISGIKEKYPSEIIKNRIETEGNVVSCCMKDMLLIDDINLTSNDFVTTDGRFYYRLLKQLRKKGYCSLDEVTIISELGEETVEEYKEKGGWKTIQHQIDIINTDNFTKYLDNLYKEKILKSMYDDGIDLTKKIKLGERNVVAINFLRTLDAEGVIEWWESRLTSYNAGGYEKILEEDDIDFDDRFIESCINGEEMGVPFDIAGKDADGNDITCFPFLSRQTMGLLEGTFTMLGGYSSSGKSTFWVGVLSSLLYYNRKILIISNEESIKKFKAKFLVWMLARYSGYYKLTKKKLLGGDITEENLSEIKKIQKIWREKGYNKRLRYIAISDADMNIVKKKIQEYVLKEDFDTVLYDTFKIQENDFSNTRQDLALVRDSRDLDKIAKKYHIIMLASVQLAEYTKGKLFLDSSVLSNSKQVKEVLENLYLMRTVYQEELDPKNKLYCRPFRQKKTESGWIEEEYQPDPSGVWRMLFVEKTRNGDNSSDTGIAYLLRYAGDFATFKESCKCRPRHSTIT